MRKWINIQLREYASTVLIWLSILIGEIHTLFGFGQKLSNWILFREVPMTTDWNVKGVENELWPLWIVAAWVLWKENKINRVTRKVLVVFLIADVFLYFLNYKDQVTFIFVYPALMIYWLVLLFRR